MSCTKEFQLTIDGAPPWWDISWVERFTPSTSTCDTLVDTTTESLCSVSIKRKAGTYVPPGTLGTIGYEGTQLVTIPGAFSIKLEYFLKYTGNIGTVGLKCAGISIYRNSAITASYTKLLSGPISGSSTLSGESIVNFSAGTTVLHIFVDAISHVVDHTATAIFTAIEYP